MQFYPPAVIRAVHVLLHMSIPCASKPRQYAPCVCPEDALFYFWRNLFGVLIRPLEGGKLSIFSTVGMCPVVAVKGANVTRSDHNFFQKLAVRSPYGRR